MFAGPTAVGKGTVVERLRAEHPEVWVSISMTTRPQRPGETEGVHYYFVDAMRFAELEADGAFLETAKVHGQFMYGTPKAPVLEHLRLGIPALLEIDLAGARQVRETMPDALFVFLAPPSFAELERRLLGRGTEGPAERERRLETARTELAAEAEFDVVIINDTVERAAAELAETMGLQPPH